jgi:hypothetical protein
MLSESHDQLQAKLTKEISTCPPFVLIDNACSTNPCCEHAHLVKENTMLKAQLETDLVSCIQGEKNLNDHLNNQKKVVAKAGLGFVPKSKKKNKKKKAKNAAPLKDVFVKEGEKAPKEKWNKGVGGNATRGKTTHPDFAGKFNHSYVLCRASDGHFYAKFVGSPYEYIEWSIWMPRTLVANKRGPIQEWVPKTKPYSLVGVCFRWRFMVARQWSNKSYDWEQGHGGVS